MASKMVVLTSQRALSISNNKLSPKTVTKTVFAILHIFLHFTPENFHIICLFWHPAVR